MSNDTSIPEGFKRCYKCSEVKSLNEFSADRRKRDGKRCICKNCDNMRHRQYWVSENAPPYKRREQYSPEKQEELREWGRQKYRQNAELREYKRRYHIAHRTERAEYHRDWYSKHRDELRERNRRRRTRERSLPFDFTLNDEIRALNYFNGCCAVCRRPLRDLFNEHTVAFDHWIALSDPRPDNPGTVPWNMVPLCHGINGCNSKKQDTDPIKWLTECYGPREVAKIVRRITEFFNWIRDDSDND